MKKWMILSLVLALAAALPLAAGDYKCNESTDTCLKMMAEKLRGRGWVGIEMDEAEDGTLTVKKVIPGSPAEAAGFQAGDALAAMNGVRFSKENEASLKETYKSFTPGNTVNYTVARGDSEVDLEIKLASLPETVMAQWIGQHMLEHHLKSGEKEMVESP